MPVSHASLLAAAMQVPKPQKMLGGLNDAIVGRSLFGSAAGRGFLTHPGRKTNGCGQWPRRRFAVSCCMQMQVS